MSSIVTNKILGLVSVHMINREKATVRAFLPIEASSRCY